MLGRKEFNLAEDCNPGFLHIFILIVTLLSMCVFGALATQMFCLEAYADSVSDSVEMPSTIDGDEPDGAPVSEDALRQENVVRSSGITAMEGITAPEGKTEGFAYAVFTEADSTLTFTRSEQANIVNSTITDINGDEWQGTIWRVNEVKRRIEYSSDVPWYYYQNRITRVRIAEGVVIAPVNCASWFANCTLLSDCDLTRLDLSGCVNVGAMFQSCSQLTTLDGSHWDTSNVENMGGMFLGCSALTSVTALENWNTSKVTSMTAMFRGCSSMAFPDLSGWDTSKVSTFDTLFQNCTQLTSLPGVGQWNVSSATSMNSMFSGCSSLVTADLSEWASYFHVTSLNCTFSGCSSLAELNLDDLDTRQVSDFYGMVQNCVKLEKVKFGENWTFQSTTSGMYNTAFHLPTPSSTYIPGADGNWYSDQYDIYAEADLTRNWDGSTMAGWWYAKKPHGTGYAVLITADASTNSSYAGSIGDLVLFRSWTEYTNNTVTATIDLDGTTRYGRVYANVETANISSYSSVPWYSYRTSVKKIYVAQDQILKPQKMMYWFYGCSALTECNFTGLNTGRVTDLTYTFYGCTNSAFTSLDLSEWDTSKVTQMKSTFYNCQYLSELNIESWDSSKVTAFHNMFDNCYRLARVKFGSSWCFQNYVPSSYSMMKCTLPTPSSSYISGASGKWYGPNNESYTPADLIVEWEASTMAGWWTASSSNGTTFAVLITANASTDPSYSGEIGDFVFFKSANSYVNGNTAAAVDVDGVVRYGRVYSDIEADLGSSSRTWLSYKTSIQRVYSAEGQTIVPVNMAGWFSGCAALYSCDLSGFDTSHVHNMSSLFYQCTNANFTTLDLSMLDTSHVVNMSRTFAECQYLSELNIDGWSSSSVTDFRKCALDVIASRKSN